MWSVEHCLNLGNAAVGARQETERNREAGMSVVPPSPLHIAMDFFTGSAVTFSKYRAILPFRHLRRPGDANSFLLTEQTLASSYGD